MRKEALLTSQLKGTQTSLTDLLDKEAGFATSNTDDAEEVTSYLRYPRGRTWSVRILCDAPPPPLVKTALIHLQFETIHPSLDGNGRKYRLMIAALLEQWGSAVWAIDVP